MMEAPTSFRDLLLPHFVEGVSDALLGVMIVAMLVIVAGLLALLNLTRGRRRKDDD